MEWLFRDEQKKVKKRKKAAKATLSFALDDEDGGGDRGADTPEDADDDKPSKRAKLRKNPNVDTSFLPDREREEEERRQRETLRQEWLRKQEDMKKEEIEITYSYWDGSGHRKSATVGFVFRASGRAAWLTTQTGVYACMYRAGTLVQEGRRHRDVLGEV